MRKIFTKIVITFTLLVVYNFSYAQFYDTGCEPTSIKWEQINTKNFQIIFAEDFYSQANKLANILDYSYNNISKSLNHKPKKISIILHNNTVNSNGYVSWAPKRIEMYATPSQKMYYQPWLEQLCVHEFRHVVQIDKLNQGITKILSLLFGQQAIGDVVGMLPLWYLEGDAVYTETVLTKAGRGRLPVFEKEFRTILLSDEKLFSFDKTLFGSYKNYVPNHYKYGYDLTSYARMKYGDSIWVNTENYVAKHPYTIFPTTVPLYFALKKYAGISQEQLYNETYSYLDSLWKSEDIEFVDYNKIINVDKEGYENYFNPQYVGNNKIVAFKRGLSHILQIVLIDSLKQTVLCKPGILSSEDLAYANNKLVWSERRHDVRWKNREYSEIKILDIRNKKAKTISLKTRYFAPDLSNNANKIAAIEVNEKNQCYLVFLSTFNGDVYNKIESPEGIFLQNPKWSNDNKFVYVIGVSKNGKGILRYNINNKVWENILAFDYEDIQNIRLVDDNLYFHSSYSGIDNIYLYNLNTSESFKITASQYGMADFDVNENNSALIASEYSSQGGKIVSVPLNLNSFEEKSKVSTRNLAFEQLINKEKSLNIHFDSIDNKEFAAKPFRKWQNAFNFHSWLPFYFDYEDYTTDFSSFNTNKILDDLAPGLMLISQDKLSTTTAILGYGYKNGSNKFYSSLIYKGLYPEIRISSEYGEQIGIVSGSADWMPEIGNTGTDLSIETILPFDFSMGSNLTFFRPSIKYSYNNSYYYNYVNNNYIKGMQIMQYRLYFGTYKHLAKCDIQPKFGFITNINLINTPFEDEIFGSIFYSEGIVFLPGLFKNHGIKISEKYQEQNSTKYFFNSQLNFPRGMEKQFTEKLFLSNIDYVLPIVYPDLSLGSFAYLKRIKADLFFDYGLNQFRYIDNNTGNILWAKDNIYSVGCELTADYHLFRIQFPFESGIRYSFLPETNNYKIEAIFSIDLY